MNCVIAGAGAIGKAVAGYCFKSIGADVTFIDADINTIDDINKRKSYVIYSTEFNKDSFSETVCDVKAVSVFDVASDKVLSDADVVCTAMGEKGLEAFLPKFINNLKIRIDSGNTSRLILLLCENIEDCLNKVIKKIESEIIIPDFLIVKAACIERMSGVIKENDNELNVLCEQHFPIIIEKKRLEDTAFAMNPKYFMLTDNIDLYYKRKLYLGNLGHAVLGYFGLKKEKKTEAENCK